MSNPLEMLEVVDENDNVIDLENRLRIHQEGLLHREIHIWFITPNGEIILQHRSKNKDTNADKLDATVGGHVEPGMSYEATAIKECKEETGLDVEVQQLVAVFDKKMHAHPPQNVYVYKMVFHCTAITETIHTGFDVLDAQYFNMNELPPLSEDRILASQIQLVYDKILSGDNCIYVD